MNDVHVIDNLQNEVHGLKIYVPLPQVFFYNMIDNDYRCHYLYTSFVLWHQFQASGKGGMKSGLISKA